MRTPVASNILVRHAVTASLSLAVAGFSTLACSDVFSSSDDNGPSGATDGDGGVVSGGKNAPPGCDAEAEPAQAACVIDEGVGIFASATQGSDSADGSRAHPLKSIAKAIELAQAAGGKNVYACAETYPESITLASGVSVFGYFDCSSPNWSVAQDRHALLKAPTSPAVTAKNITDPTRFIAVDVVAPDGTKGTPTSIAILADKAVNLRVAQAKVQAGKGLDGADGVDGTQLADSATKNGAAGLLESTCQLGAVGCQANHNDCNDAVCYQAHVSSPTGGTNACTGAAGHAAGSGGAGGAGGHWQKFSSDNCHAFTHTEFYDGAIHYFATPGAGQPGGGGAPGGQIRYDDRAASSPTTACLHFRGSDGTGGAKGKDGNDGASAKAPGALSSTGFTPADGALGSDGAPGGGGGGGAGSVPLNISVYPDNAETWGIVGSGGGAGGCPGLAGTAGKGGGASIVLLATDSPIELDGVTLQAGDGGRGGDGTFGSDATAGGQPGNAPEPGPNDPQAGNSKGGAGGDGGRAGVSGAGAGGSSIVIAAHGVAPVVGEGTVLTPGKAGAGRPARNHADGVRVIAASPDGVASANTTF